MYEDSHPLAKIRLLLQLTVMNAGRRRFHTSDLAGKVFVTSGLGGMSGAQAKAAVIAGVIGVVAEVWRSSLLSLNFSPTLSLQLLSSL